MRLAVRPVYGEHPAGQRGRQDPERSRRPHRTCGPRRGPTSASRHRSSTSTPAPPAAATMAVGGRNGPRRTGWSRTWCPARACGASAFGRGGRLRPPPRRTTADRCARSSARPTTPCARAGPGRCRPPAQRGARSTGPETAAASNVAIPSRTATAASTRRHRQGRAGPLAQPQVELEQRSQAEPIEDDRVARLDAAMTGDRAARRRTAARPGREQRRGARDEAVEDDRDPGLGGAEDRPDERPDLEPADGRQHADRVGRVGPVPRERALDDRDLAATGRVVDAGAAAGDAVRGRCRSGPRVIALAAVVLPMPISPTPRRSTPRSRSVTGQVDARRRSRAPPRRGSSPDRPSCRRCRRGCGPGRAPPRGGRRAATAGIALATPDVDDGDARADRRRRAR